MQRCFKCLSIELPQRLASQSMIMRRLDISFDSWEQSEYPMFRRFLQEITASDGFELNSKTGSAIAIALVVSVVFEYASFSLLFIVVTLELMLFSSKPQCTYATHSLHRSRLLHWPTALALAAAYSGSHSSTPCAVCH